jgi:hypothetical protein
MEITRDTRGKSQQSYRFGGLINEAFLRATILAGKR